MGSPSGSCANPSNSSFKNNTINTKKLLQLNFVNKQNNNNIKIPPENSKNERKYNWQNLQLGSLQSPSFPPPKKPIRKNTQINHEKFNTEPIYLHINAINKSKKKKFKKPSFEGNKPTRTSSESSDEQGF